VHSVLNFLHANVCPFRGLQTHYWDLFVLCSHWNIFTECIAAYVRHHEIRPVQYASIDIKMLRIWMAVTVIISTFRDKMETNVDINAK